MKKEVNNKAHKGYVAGGTAFYVADGTPFSRNDKLFKYLIEKINPKNTTKIKENLDFQGV